MNVVVIDSGVSKEIMPFNYKGLTIKKEFDTFWMEEGFHDDIGHGTAVTQLFLNNIENKELLNIHIIKLDSNLYYGYDVETLLYALDFINNNISCDLLIICSGIRTYNPLLYSKLKNFYDRGMVIFSAFDNMGSMSYPAAFDCVIGVDVSDEIYVEADSFIAILNNPINIIKRNSNYRVNWINNRINIVKGSSFACGDIAGKFANYSILHREKTIKENLKNFLEKQTSSLVINTTREEQKLKKCKKAVVFPFNKEIHSLAMNEDLLVVEILDYYDIRQSGKVNLEISKLLTLSNNSKRIKNIANLDWESDFDTVILGHCDKYQKILGFDLKEEIIKKCEKYNKFLILLDNINGDRINDKMHYYPYVDKSSIPMYNLGKMYISNTPIIGVFGTSSKQGKFTLQLMLRRLFLKDGYAVAQIGTEPTSILYGMDYVFPMGYNSTVHTTQNENVIILNEFVHRCEEKSPDIIIVGSQSGTCPYNIYNINLFTLPQIEFLLGTQPDIVVLNVNVCDNIDYIERTIKTIEGTVDCKVIAFALFPRRVNSKVEMTSSVVTEEERKSYKELLEDRFKIPVFHIDFQQIERLYEYIIDYLS